MHPPGHAQNQGVPYQDGSRPPPFEATDPVQPRNPYDGIRAHSTMDGFAGVSASSWQQDGWNSSPLAAPIPLAHGPHIEALPTLPAAPKPGKGLAITTFVLGLVASLVWWFPVLGGIVALAAVLFGIFALVGRQSKAFTIIGLVFGGLALVAQIVVMVWVLTLPPSAETATALTVPAADVEAQAAAALAPHLQYTPAIACSGDLAGRVGESLDCELTDNDGVRHVAVIVVTGVDGQDVAFDVDVDTLTAP